ncbi:MAG: hypothetical protein KF763_13735 [Cyclobacteriaceae bacterium]|nr:hypothetical protein [Cyclobacteriaceae bacterium]
MFDLSQSSSGEQNESLFKLDFIRPQFITNPVYFIFNDKIKKSLIYWKDAKKEVGETEMYIPFIEYWSKTSLQVLNCKEIIRVNFLKDSLESLTDDEPLNLIQGDSKTH